MGEAGHRPAPSRVTRWQRIFLNRTSYQGLVATSVSFSFAEMSFDSFHCVSLRYATCWFDTLYIIK